MPKGKQKSRRITTLSTLAVAAILLLGGVYLANVSSKLAYQRQRNFRIAATLAEITEKKIHNVAKIVQIEALRIPAEALGPEATDEPYKRFDHLPCFHHVHWHPGDNEHGRSTIEPKITDLAFRRKVKDGGTLHLEADIDCFFRDLERPEVFDDVVILSSKGGVIFQAGTSITRLRELSSEGSVQASISKEEGEAPGAAALLGGLSRLQEVELAGDHYALFRQPLRLDLLLEGESEPPKWELVGLVRSDRLLAEALRIDPARLALFVAVLLLLLCAWPLFKLWATGPRERLHPAEVRRVSLTLVVGTALLAIFGLAVGLHGGLHRELEEDLEQTASRIQSSLETEIGDALIQLGWLNEHRRSRSVEAGTAGAAGDGLEGCQANDELFRRSGELWGEQGPYSHSKMVFWTAENGKQVEKWAIDESTPMINVQGREYFQRVIRRELWSPDRWVEDGSPGTDFFVQPIRSWTTGKQEVVLSVPYQIEAPACKPPAVAAMIITRLPSMLRPILPPGRDFAVVDRQGQVVFHSQPERNGVENFLEECEGAPALRGALFSRTPRHFTTRYRGRERVMFARPLAGLPWHLVVFEDKAVCETVNLEAMEAAVLLSLFQLLLLGFALLLIRGVGGPGTLRSLWPAPDDLATHGRMTAVLLLIGLGLVLSLLVLRSSPRSLVAGGLLLPLAALGWTVAATSPSQDRSRRRHRAALGVGLTASGLFLALEAQALAAGEWAWTAGAILLLHTGLLGLAAAVAWAGPRSSVARACSEASSGLFQRLRLSPTVAFVAAGLVLLTVISALPAATFLQASYGERLVLEARRGQMHLARELSLRHRRIRHEYRNSGTPSLWEQALADHRDVHHQGYFGTSFTQPRLLAIWPFSDLLDMFFLSGGSGELRQRAPRNLFTGWPFSAFPHVNTHSILARGAVDAEDRIPVDSRSWSRTVASGRLLLVGAPPTGEPLVIVSSRVGGIAPSSPGLTLLTVVLFAAGVAGALVFVGRRIFHIDFRLPEPPSLSELEEMYYARLLVVVPPGTKIGSAFGSAELSVDLAGSGTPGGDHGLEKLDTRRRGLRLPWKKPAKGLAKGLVRIDHLEGALDDAPSREKTLPLFEAALSRSGEDARIVVFCHRDPRAVLEAAEAQIEKDSDSRQTVQRWRELLDGLAEEWVPDRGDPEDFEKEVLAADLPVLQRTALIRECCCDRILQKTGRQLLRRGLSTCREPEDVVQRVAQEADDHYRALWQALAAEERHVLEQIASGCLVNRRLRKPLERLLRWNLVVRRLSTFEVMNESFRRFVMSHHDPEALHEWEEAAAVGVWRRVRVPFFAALGAIALFLLVTQRDLFNITLAFASAAAASLPAALQLFRWIRRAREG